MIQSLPFFNKVDELFEIVLKDKDTILKMQVDKILDKLNDKGWESLTCKEEELLTKASKKYFDDHTPN